MLGVYLKSTPESLHLVQVVAQFEYVEVLIL
jgi:hypothetical protein